MESGRASTELPAQALRSLDTPPEPRVPQGSEARPGKRQLGSSAIAASEPRASNDCHCQWVIGAPRSNVKLNRGRARGCVGHPPTRPSAFQLATTGHRSAEVDIPNKAQFTEEERLKCALPGQSIGRAEHTGSSEFAALSLSKAHVKPFLACLQSAQCEHRAESGSLLVQQERMGSILGHAVA